MLSAVENFGTAAAAATHAYAHHHNLSIAAAAAAASTAAAAVIPTQQAALDHHHRHMLAHSSLSNAGLLLPSSQLSALASTEGQTTISSRNLSSSSLNSKVNNSFSSAPATVAMSSAEFVRPHPKQPRYSSSISSNNTSAVNSNGTSNGIPLQVRTNKVSSGSNSLSSPRSKYSTEQSGPVNLVTSNNNSSSGGSNSSSSPPVKSPALETIPPHSPSEREREILAGMYAQKLPFSTNVSAEAAAVAAAFHQSLYRSLYPDPALYHQMARNQLHASPYISDQFPAYRHPTQNAYSPPAPQTLLGPPPPPPSTVATTLLGSPHGATSLLNNSHNNSTSLSNQQLPLMLDRHATSLHHVNSHIPQHQPHLGLDRQHMSQSKEKEPRGSAQMNGKVHILPETQAGFKVPSGKEGSMKHRILTRPSTTSSSSYSDKDLARRRSPVSAAVYRNSSNNNSPTNFTKGSLIELSTGELRRVEDMRTEDFVQSAERSQHLELADSTVVKISNNAHAATITFSYNKNRSKVDIDGTIEHPFFVYGQGWASCNPDLTLKTYGLKCQRLQVGDVCISLKPRESSSSCTPSTPHSPNNYTQHSPHQQYKNESSPQNLSRKTMAPFSSASLSATIPTTATSIAVCSRPSVPIMSHLPPPTSSVTHFPSVHSYDMLRTYRTSPPGGGSTHHTSATAVPQNHLHHAQRQKIEGHVVLARNSNDHRPSPSPPSCRPPSNQPYYLGTASDKCNGRDNPIIENVQAGDDEQDTVIDASLARKRRWSWSNTVNGRNREGMSPPKTVCNS